MIKKLSNIHLFGLNFVTHTFLEENRVIKRFEIERDLKLWITTSLSKTTIFWDAGGCVGNFSIYAARTGSRVLVFEPDGLTYSSLLKNTFNSNLKNISVYPIALGNHDKFSSLIMKKFEIANAYNSVENPESPIDRSIKPEYEQNVCEYKASTLISNHAFPVPTHIKIDVDGNEL